MNQGEDASETVSDICQDPDGTSEFVDKVNGAEIAEKLLKQIEELQGAE